MQSCLESFPLSFISQWMAQKGSQPVKASPGFISKTNIPIPAQKAAIPKIRINGSWTSIFWLYRKKEGEGREEDRVIVHAW